MSLTYSQALTVVNGIHRHADTLHIRVSAVVVDSGGFVVAAGRMDGAPPLSSQVAEAKATGAAVWQRSGEQLVDLQQDRPAFFQAASSFVRLPVIPSLGSVLVRDGERVIGAVGVSGGSPQQDVECADAGLRSALELVDGVQSTNSHHSEHRSAR